MVFTRNRLVCGIVVMFVSTIGFRSVSGDQTPKDLQPFTDASGTVLTVSTQSTFDTQNPFFQSLGTNGRSCGTCHQARDGWTVSAAHIQQRFDDTDGLDPIFRLNDGANCSTADVSTVAARKTAYSLLLNKGLIRVALPMPDGAEFSLLDIDDPYGCISNGDLSMYRRPLPSTNLKFLSAVMWDGRETHSGSMTHNLTQQATDATMGHAQGTVPPTAEQLQQIVDFESALFTAQARDRSAGRLDDDGALGGARSLSLQNFFIGINDPIGLNPTGEAFDPRVFVNFSAWASSDSAARRAIARGQEIFNTRPIAISGVAGLNDALGQPSLRGTCTTCHDTPNSGNHSVSMALNIGISDESRRTPDLPLYTFRCDATGELIRTSDPGRAMLTGKCADIGKVKGPILRGLSARAPYFHNGSAATLDAVVDFYNERFGLGLTSRERADLVAFLKAL